MMGALVYVILCHRYQRMMGALVYVILCHRYQRMVSALVYVILCHRYQRMIGALVYVILCHRYQRMVGALVYVTHADIHHLQCLSVEVFQRRHVAMSQAASSLSHRSGTALLTPAC
jgi:hypothetical protein